MGSHCLICIYWHNYCSRSLGCWDIISGYWYKVIVTYGKCRPESPFTQTHSVIKARIQQKLMVFENFL